MSYQLWHVIAASTGAGFICANFGVIMGGYLASLKVADLEWRIGELEHFIKSVGQCPQQEGAARRMPESQLLGSGSAPQTVRVVISDRDLDCACPEVRPRGQKSGPHVRRAFRSAVGP